MRAKKKVEEPKAEQPEQPALRLEWRTPQELVENPRNWRTHPAGQTKALQGVMQEVGWAGALLYNEASGRLIDGHARRKLALEQGSERVPVLVGSWTEAQERLILATLDPIGALAEQDDAALQSLIDEVSTETPEMKALLDEILVGEQDADSFEVNEAPAPELPEGKKPQFQNMAFTLHDSQAEVLKASIKKAIRLGGGKSEINRNSNGNALAFIAERFVRG